MIADGHPSGTSISFLRFAPCRLASPEPIREKCNIAHFRMTTEKSAGAQNPPTWGAQQRDLAPSTGAYRAG